MAHADTVTPVSGNANNQTDQVNKDPNQQSQSKGAVVHHDQTVTPTLTTSQQVSSQEQPNKQATISDSTALNSQQRKETTSTFLNTNYIIASVQNGRALTESKVSTNGGGYTANMTVSKEELESRFTWTVDTDGNVEVTGLKDASYMRDGGILVLPNARDFIDAGIITAGHTASITNKTLWHMIWDKHSQDLKELDVSNNGNQKLILLPPDDSEYDYASAYPFANNNITDDARRRYFSIRRMNLNQLDVSNIKNFSMMFQEAKSLVDLAIGDWNVSNGVTFETMFNDCSNLTQLDVANWDVSNGKSFSYMFADCYNLKSLAVANWNVANGTDFSAMFGMFDGDSKLVTLDVTNWNVANGTNFFCMFYKDISLKALDVSKWNVANGTNFGFMFNFDTQLTALDVSKWNVANGTNFSTMFAQDNKLRTLDVANWDVSKGTAFDSMFYNTNGGITYLDLQNWKIDSQANTNYMFGKTSLVAETKEQDPSLNNDQAKTQLAAINQQQVTLNHDHITVNVNPSTQQFYYLPSTTLNDDLAKIQSKINANNPFFEQYAALLTQVKTPAQNDPDRGLELKAIILLAQLADADTSAQADSGYKYTGLSSSSTSSSPNDILTATYTMNATPQPSEGTWAKTKKTNGGDKHISTIDVKDNETITQLPADKPEEPIGTSTTKPVANQSSVQQQKQQQQLPQTGDNHETSIVGLGLTVAMISMFGLKKRKED